MEYTTHTYRLMPLLARSVAFHFALQYLTDRYTNRSEDDIGEVHVLASGFKAVVTWDAVKAMQTCRECCGGQGCVVRREPPMCLRDGS